MFVQPPTDPRFAAASADYLDQQRERWGFVPDYAGCFAARPDVAEAWSALARAVMAPMDRRRFELATLAAARARRSTYCAAAHSTFLRDACGDEATMLGLAADPSGGGLGEVDRAVHEYASLVARDPASVQQTDIDRLRELGLTDSDIADLAYTVALRVFFTTVLDALGARLDAATAAELPPDVLAALVVGRPPLES